MNKIIKLRPQKRYAVRCIICGKLVPSTQKCPKMYNDCGVWRHK